MANISLIFGLLALSISLSVAQVNPDFFFELDNAIPMEGDIVTFTCTAKDLPLTSLMQMERLSSSGPPVIIGQNGNKQDVIDSLERYTMSIDSDTLTFTMVITGVRVEDSGTFKCGDPKTLVFQELEIQVRAEPTTISLTLDGQEVTDGEEFEMKAGDVKDITCSVGGSNPAPDVKVIVEDKNGKTVKDLSKNFQMVKTEEVVLLDDPISTFDKKLWSTVASVTSLTISSEFSMKFVKCIGSIEGGKNPVQKSFFVRFSGMPPIFDCESDYVSFLGDKKFNITCQVKAEPTLTGSSVTWYTGIYKNFSRSVTDKNYNNGQYVYWQKKVNNENAWDLILYVDTVHLQMFGNYTFEAKNDYGVVQHMVTLHRDETREVYSAAITMTPVLLLTIAMALTSVYA